MSGGCADMGRFTPDPALFAPGQYTSVSNQAHVVMALACLCCTVSFGLHSVAIGGLESWVPRVLRRGEGASVISGTSLATAGVYLYLRVMFACDGCVSSGYVARDIVQQQHLAIAAALQAAGAMDVLHGLALRSKRRCSDSGSEQGRIEVFLAGWVHDCWFASITAIGLIFIAHPQANTRNAALHVTIGVALVIGAHAIAGERRNGFLPKLVLVNGAVDGEAIIAAPAAMEAIGAAPRMIFVGGLCFPSAAISLAAFQESESAHVGVDVACSPAGYALVVGTEAWALLLAAVCCVVAALKVDLAADTEHGDAG